MVRHPRLEEIEMADVGDRIAVVSKGKPRSGVLIAVSGAMITVRWDTGGETSLIPGPGVLSVVNSRRTSSAGRKATAGSKPAAKKPVAKGTSSSRTTAKKTR
jgi:hypothetical protein